MTQCSRGTSGHALLVSKPRAGLASLVDVNLYWGKRLDSTSATYLTEFTPLWLRM